MGELGDVGLARSRRCRGRDELTILLNFGVVLFFSMAVGGKGAGIEFDRIGVQSIAYHMHIPLAIIQEAEDGKNTGGRRPLTVGDIKYRLKCVWTSGISIQNQVHSVVNYISGMEVMEVQVIYMNVQREEREWNKA